MYMYLYNAPRVVTRILIYDPLNHLKYITEIIYTLIHRRKKYNNTK